MRKIQVVICLLAGWLLTACSPDTATILRSKTTAYFEAWNRQDFKSPAFASFKLDTSLVWHGKKEGPGIVSIFNPNSGWKQWDVAWYGTYDYEITQVNVEELSVTGSFQETHDFFKRIGMPEGLSAKVTFWFNEDLKVKETFYDWSPDNRSMHDLIKPMVEWAKVHDSIRINNIYLQEGFVPSTENAREWQVLFDLYEAGSP